MDKYQSQCYKGINNIEMRSTKFRIRNSLNEEKRQKKSSRENEMWVKNILERV